MAATCATERLKRDFHGLRRGGGRLASSGNFADLHPGWDYRFDGVRHGSSSVTRCRKVGMPWRTDAGPRFSCQETLKAPYIRASPVRGGRKYLDEMERDVQGRRGYSSGEACPHAPFSIASTTALATGRCMIARQDQDRPGIQSGRDQLMVATVEPLTVPARLEVRRRWRMRMPEGPSPGDTRSPADGPPTNGSASRTRTCDPVVNSHLLYQLSYRGSGVT